MNGRLQELLARIQDDELRAVLVTEIERQAVGLSCGHCPEYRKASQKLAYLQGEVITLRHRLQERTVNDRERRLRDLNGHLENFSWAYRGTEDG